MFQVDTGNLFSAFQDSSGLLWQADFNFLGKVLQSVQQVTLLLYRERDLSLVPTESGDESGYMAAVTLCRMQRESVLSEYQNNHENTSLSNTHTVLGTRKALMACTLEHWKVWTLKIDWALFFSGALHASLARMSLLIASSGIV